MLKFISYRELRNTPSKVWEALREYAAVAITANGEPRAIMLNVDDGDVETTLELVRRVRAQMALSRIRAKAAVGPSISDAEIDAEVQAARREHDSRMTGA